MVKACLSFLLALLARAPEIRTRSHITSTSKVIMQTTISQSSVRTLRRQNARNADKIRSAVLNTPRRSTRDLRVCADARQQVSGNDQEVEVLLDIKLGGMDDLTQALRNFILTKHIASFLLFIKIFMAELQHHRDFRHQKLFHWNMWPTSTSPALHQPFSHEDVKLDAGGSHTVRANDERVAYCIDCLPCEL